MNFVALIVSALSGMAMAIQGTMNSALGKIIGLLPTVLVVNLVGFVTATLLLFGLRLENFVFSKFSTVPWYLYLGGVIGILITYGVIFAIPKTGVAFATAAIILGQVLTAVLIDSFGIFGMQKVNFTWHKIAGALFMTLGAWFLLKK